MNKTGHSCLEVLVILWKGCFLGFFDVLFYLCLPGGVHGDLWGHKCGHGNELQVGVSDQLPCQPEEGLFEVVVGLRRDVIVLEVLLAVKDDRLGLDLPVLDVHLVPSEDNGDVFAHPNKVPVPVWNILVGHTRSYVEHDNGALSLKIQTE